MGPLNLLSRLRHRTPSPQSDTAAAMIAREELSGIKLGVAVRILSIATINLLTILFWEGFEGKVQEALASDSFHEMLYEIGITLPFLLGGLAQLAMVYYRPHWRWVLYATVLLDVVLLPVVILFPSPFHDPEVPLAIVLRTAVFNYFYLMGVVVALAYSWRLMLWFGGCVFFVWNGTAAWLTERPDALLFEDVSLEGASTADILALYLHPNYVDVDKAFEQTIILMIASAGLAVAVRRFRKLVHRSVAAEIQKTSLSRYFSPNVAARLAEQGGDVGQAQRGKVAILFADIVGFTGLTEGKPPEAVLDLLRDFHGRMEAQVFAHDGTLEKYIGDALLATFGTPEAGAHDATDALRCAFAMQAELDRWNALRLQRGDPAVRASIGIHYGEAVMGNIGRDRNMAFVVVGSSVNIASRLQSLGRHLDASLVISDALARQAEGEGGIGAGRLAGFTLLENQYLRGMQMAIDLRYLPRNDNS